MNSAVVVIACAFALTLSSCKDEMDKGSMPAIDGEAITPVYHSIYKNKQIALFDSIYCSAYGTDSTTPRLTMFLMNPTNLCSLIKVYPCSQDSSVLITIAEFSRQDGVLMVESRNSFQRQYSPKLELQIAYLVNQIDTLSKRIIDNGDDRDATFLYCNEFNDSTTFEVSLGNNIFSIENQAQYRNVLTGIWLLTSTTLYRNIFEYYPYLEEQVGLLNY
ncbi:MAG TPA: hypothetical protein PKL06_08560 [Chitinophagales bacterium]|nr:hypothetical protein [Chitinophagales bacterium]